MNKYVASCGLHRYYFTATNMVDARAKAKRYYGRDCEVSWQ